MPKRPKDVIYTHIFDESQRRLYHRLYRFSREHVAPKLAEMHEKQEIPPDLVDRLKKGRVFAIGIPKKYGGSGGGLVSSAIRAEALGYGSGAVALLAGISSGVTAKTILGIGTERQKQRWVRPLTAGTIGTFQLTEPGAGSDAGAVLTKASIDGKRILLNGNKIFVTNGPLPISESS